MPGAKEVHHATVLVTDLEQAEAFYGGVLGLPRIPRPELPSEGLWYEIEGVQLHLIRTTEAEAATTRHIAFVVEDLESMLERVRKMGLPIWDDIQIAGFVRKHCRDPFGNGVELLQALENGSAPLAANTSHVGKDGTWKID